MITLSIVVEGVSLSMNILRLVFISWHISQDIHLGKTLVIWDKIAVVYIVEARWVKKFENSDNRGERFCGFESCCFT
jgi:hypothetical protein